MNVGHVVMNNVARFIILGVMLSFLSFCAIHRFSGTLIRRFGLELPHLNHAAATGFVTLQQENLANPNPGLFFTLWRGSHPSIAQRIEFFNTYRPWETGEVVKYGKLFEEGK